MIVVVLFGAGAGRVVGGNVIGNIPVRGPTDGSPDCQRHHNGPDDHPHRSHLGPVQHDPESLGC
jgi:hypothetical protein